jgi:ABC-type multidrug transport system fused ATPase/permease subunit
MARRPKVKSISALEAVRPFRWRIGLTYTLTFIEDLLELSYPWATGLAIDGLLRDELWEAAPIVVAWTLRSGIGLFRQMYDTRLYTDVYNTIVEDTILRQRKAGIKATTVAARSAMSRDFVTFFEKDVPVLVTSLIGIVGSAAILFWYDLIIGAIAASLFIPVILVNRLYIRVTLRLNEGLNTQLEQEVQAIEKAEGEPLKHHFDQVRCWRIRLSDAEAYNWTFIEVLSIFVFVAVLVRATYLDPGPDDILAGQIFAILTYVWRLMENLDNVPQLVQQITRLHDIRKRIEAGASVEAIGAEVEKAHEGAAESSRM